MGSLQDAGKQAALLAFGHLLKRLRIAADLTQEELAERSLVSARLISDLERGSMHRPRRDTVQLLADGLRLSGQDRDAFVALARGKPHIAPDTAGDAAPRHGLPHPPTPIVGRLKETAAATALLLDPEVRLLTLTGPGGVGKTRLALEVAFRSLDALPDGAWFVDLAPVRDPDHVIAAIGRALGPLANPDQPLRQRVIDTLRDKRLLLVLDNFEHIAVAAPAVADLLSACPALTVLATSRAPLHIRAEREYALGPLALPDPHNVPPLAELATIPAVDLFLRRAESANRSFTLTQANASTVVAIAVQLDGLPLAIELAATRLKVLTAPDLLSRLEQRLPLLTGGAQDLPPRQQALRATLDWSHEILSLEEQTLFRRLSIFAGGCTLEAAEWVSGVGCRVSGEPLAATARLLDSSPSRPVSDTRPPTPDTLNLLASLVDQSLLRRHDEGDEPRFAMLETIREYGLERLAESGEEETVRDSHATWHLTLAERAEPELTGADQQQWFARLQREHDNLRGALEWAISRRDAETALRLGGSLYRYWATQGHYEEGSRWLDRALALDPDGASPARGNSLLGAGVMAFFQGKYDDAARSWQDALALFRSLEDLRGVAYAYGNLGLVADAQGDYERATASYEAALARFRQLDDQTFIGYMLHNLGLIAYFQGDYARATSLYEESLALVRGLGDDNGIALTLGNLGLVAFVQGDYQRAQALQEESLTLGRRSTNKPWLARSLENFALIAAATRESERATRLFGAAAALRSRFGATLPPSDREFNERYIAEARDHLGAEAFTAAWAAGEELTVDDAIDIALARQLQERAL